MEKPVCLLFNGEPVMRCATCSVSITLSSPSFGGIYSQNSHPVNYFWLCKKCHTAFPYGEFYNYHEPYCPCLYCCELFPERFSELIDEATKEWLASKELQSFH